MLNNLSTVTFRRTTPAAAPNLILTTNHFNLIMDLRGKPMKTAVVETTPPSWSLQKHSNITELSAFNRDVFVKLVLLKNKKRFSTANVGK